MTETDTRHSAIVVVVIVILFITRGLVGRNHVIVGKTIGFQTIQHLEAM